MATDLKAIYSASTEVKAEFNVELFAEKWNALYPTISKSWRVRLPARDPLVCLPRRHSASVINTTNATLVGHYDAAASVTRNHRIFPSDEAVYRVV